MSLIELVVEPMNGEVGAPSTVVPEAPVADESAAPAETE